jgi:hypothetical protein
MFKKIFFSLSMLLLIGKTECLGRFGWGMCIGLISGASTGLYGSKLISWSSLEFLDQMKDTKLKRGLLRELIAFIKRREENSQCAYSGYSELKIEAEKMLLNLNQELHEEKTVPIQETPIEPYENSINLKADTSDSYKNTEFHENSIPTSEKEDADPDQTNLN